MMIYHGKHEGATPEQIGRCYDFGVRMATHVFPAMTARRKERLISEVEGFLSCLRDASPGEVGTWDEGTPLNICIGDWASEYYQHLDAGDPEVDRPGRFYNRVICCVRAAVDLAIEASAGVLGFTVGDLRRMYDGEVPAWISDQYEPAIAGQPDEATIMF